jgi:hypothetical protein
VSALKKAARRWEGGKHTAIFGRGNGADDETTGRAVENNGREDELVRCRDYQGNGPDDEVVAGICESQPDASGGIFVED